MSANTNISRFRYNNTIRKLHKTGYCVCSQIHGLFTSCTHSQPVDNSLQYLRTTKGHLTTWTRVLCHQVPPRCFSPHPAPTTLLPPPPDSCPLMDGGVTFFPVFSDQHIHLLNAFDHYPQPNHPHSTLYTQTFLRCFPTRKSPNMCSTKPPATLTLPTSLNSDTFFTPPLMH